MARRGSIVVLAALAAAFLIAPLAPEARAQSAPAVQADPALHFARAYMPIDIYVDFVRRGLEMPVARCTAAKLLTEAQVAEIRPVIDSFLAAFAQGLPAVHEDVANAVRDQLTGLELEQAADFLTSPAGRRLLSISASAIGASVGGKRPPCDLPDEGVLPTDRRALLAQMTGATSPEDTAAMHAFFATPAGIKMGAVVPSLMPMLTQDLQQLLARATAAAAPDSGTP